MPSKRLPESLEGWLDYIDSGHSSKIDLGLDRVRAVGSLLGVTGRWPLPVITVGGTNGKGSTQAMIEAMAVAHGLRVGAYSSPHLLQYNERVRINGEPVADQPLIDAFAAVETARRQAGVTLTYFEFGTLAALWLFRHQPLDLLVLEVGLGGRLDAVNIVDADVAVVTTVALDHQDWLGSDREAIAREKVAIARPRNVLIYGESDMPVSIRQFCSQHSVKMLHWGRDFAAGAEDGARWSWSGLMGGERIRIEHLPRPRLPFANALTAIQAFCAAGMAPKADAVASALRDVRLPGRLQEISWRGRQLVLDVAHNPHAAAYIAGELKARHGGMPVLVGMLGDKPVAETLAELAPIARRWYLVTLAGERGVRAETLLDALPAAERARARCFGSVREGFEVSVEELGEREPLLICGSFVTVADALSLVER